MCQIWAPSAPRLWRLSVSLEKKRNNWPYFVQDEPNPITSELKISMIPTEIRRYFQYFPTNWILFIPIALDPWSWWSSHPLRGGRRSRPGCGVSSSSAGVRPGVSCSRSWPGAVPSRNTRWWRIFYRRRRTPYLRRRIFCNCNWPLSSRIGL